MSQVYSTFEYSTFAPERPSFKNGGAELLGPGAI